MKKKLLSVLLLAVLLVSMLPVPAQAAMTEYHIKFNEEKKLILNTSKSVTKSEWTTNNSAVVDIVDSSLFSCTVVGVDNQLGQSALITCHYWYLVGGTVLQSYEYFRVYVPEDDGGSTGASTGGASSSKYIKLSASSVTLDLAKNPTASVKAQLINGGPGNIPQAPWEFRFTMMNYADGNGADFDYDITTEGINYYMFDIIGEGVGRSQLWLYFVYNGMTLDQISIQVNVTCSHKWVKDEPNPAPNCTEEGLIGKKICSACGAEAVIDAVVPALGHDWSEWEIYQEPTLESEGIARRTCPCGAYEDEPLDRLPSDPAPSEPAPSEPAPSEPTLSEPEDTKPTDPTAPSEPAPSEPSQPETLENPFVDVVEGRFYYEPVLWAYYNGITTGKDATHFNPSGFCTRAQVVTFLWRAAGEPEPKSLINPFPDVAQGKFYTKAVLWAVEQGITAGYKDGTFGPDDACTRGQIVTFLWRYYEKPEPKSLVNPFPDVVDGKFYYKAVLWAVENGITGGFKDGTFGPDKTCTRDQIVTFLYRAMKE